MRVYIFECEVKNIEHNAQNSQNFHIVDDFVLLLYFHWHHTYSSLIPVDYGNETDDDDGEDDQNENDDVNKSDANNSTPSSQQPNNESEITGEPKVKTIETIPVGLTDENQDTNINEIIPTNENVDPTLENRNDISPSCDVNNGGCEQTCSMVSDEETGNSLAECSCRIGFYLDDEGLKCLGELKIGF